RLPVKSLLSGQKVHRGTLTSDAGGGAGNKEQNMERVSVWIDAADPISRAGVVSQLRVRPEVRIVEGHQHEEALVAMVVADSLDDKTVQQLRAAGRKGFARTVLVVGRIDDTELITAIEAGVVGLLRRDEATADQLVCLIQ